MRAFLILCAVVVACSATTNNGYSYQQQAEEPVSSGEAVLSPQLVPAVQPPAPIQQVAPAQPEFEKEFYTYSAPEHEFDDAGGNQRIVDAVKRNVRVLFVRTPENRGLENAAINLARSASDQKTAIYVLSRQADIGNLAQQLQNLRSASSSRPDVHFVKYRTEQDAANAQNTIQGQYDQLPGVSRRSNEGTAPVLNFASTAPAPVPSVVQAPSVGSQYLPAHPVSQQYIPASLLRFRR